MAEETNPSWLTPKLVLAIIMLFIVIGGLIFFGSPKIVSDLFPIFERGNLSVKWNQKVSLEYPGMIDYRIISKDSDIYFDYYVDEVKGPLGWRFKTGDRVFSYSRLIELDNFKELDSKNKKFILEKLTGKSPEAGLLNIVERVRKDGSEAGFFDKKVILMVYIGDITKTYSPNDPILKDLDEFIIKLNQISRGVSFENENL